MQEFASNASNLAGIARPSDWRGGTAQFDSLTRLCELVGPDSAGAESVNVSGEGCCASS
jgi:hypothetical protein